MTDKQIIATSKFKPYTKIEVEISDTWYFDTLSFSGTIIETESPLYKVGQTKDCWNLNNFDFKSV